MFDRERLEWLNGQWIRRLPAAELAARLEPFLAGELEAGRIDRLPGSGEVEAIVPLVQERLPVLGAIGDLVDFLFSEEVALDLATLVPKRWDEALTLEGLGAARATLEAIAATDFQADELEPPLRALADERGWKAGDLFMAIRVAVTGRTATPPLFETLAALGRPRVLARLEAALAALAAPAQGGRSMIHAAVQAWLDRYTAAWQSYRPEAIGDLFSVDARYRYHAWDEPIVGRDAIVADWLSPAATPPSVINRARSGPTTSRTSWKAGEPSRSAPRTTTPTADAPARTYYNAWLLEFDDDGRCTSFIEYYNLERTAPAAG